MSGIERARLPPIADGVVTGAALRDILGTLLRDVMRYADVRNAQGSGGVEISGESTEFATIDYNQTLQDRIFEPRYTVPDPPPVDESERILAARIFGVR